MHSAILVNEKMSIPIFWRETRLCETEANIDICDVTDLSVPLRAHQSFIKGIVFVVLRYTVIGYVDILTVTDH